MSLMDLLTGKKPKHAVAYSKCELICTGLETDTHIRHHLLEDFALACKEAHDLRKPTWMRFAAFEQNSTEALRDEVTHCSHKESAVTLISSADAELVIEQLHQLVGTLRGVHLSYARDITTSSPLSTYVIYEIMVDAGFTLPSN